MAITRIKEYIDSYIIKLIFLLLIVKLTFSYLNVKLSWWQRQLTPNIEKFNPLNLPMSFTKYLEFLMIPLMLWFLIRNYRKIGALWIPIILSGVMFILNIFTYYNNEVGFMESLEYTLKFSSPIFLFTCLIIHYRNTQFNFTKYIHVILLYCLFLTLIGLLFFDPSYNHWKNWLPIYFASLHTHTYVLVCVAIGLSFWFVNRGYYLYLILFLSLYFLFLYKGYQIRASLVFFAIFFLAITYKIHYRLKVLWVKVLAIVPVLVIAFLIFNKSFDFNKFSSGRLTMYQAKYEMLKEYTTNEYLFGKGKGSDFIRTSDWWYEEKNSHNDILTFIVENGIPYASLFLLTIVFLMIYPGRIKLIYISILLGYLVTSFLSNGIVLRTVSGYILFIVLAYVYLSNDIQKQKIDKQLIT